MVGLVLCCAMPVCIGQGPLQNDAAQAEATQATAVTEAPKAVESKPSKRQVREAEAAYAAGAKKLDANDLDGAEKDFVRALGLDPGNRNYAIAISVARQHRMHSPVTRSTR